MSPTFIIYISLSTFFPTKMERPAKATHYLSLITKMVEIMNPFNSNVESENPSSSYHTSLLVKQDYEVPKKPTKGIFLLTLSLLLLLAVLVILIGSADHGSVLRSLIQDDEISSSPPFPWNDTMLSFQRAAYHYQPEKNWMSDPNGPMFYNGWYHLFYQHNPGATVWGNIVWAHGVSKDLIHWFYLPPAVVCDEWYDISGALSGSTTILPNGSIIMAYTGHNKDLVQMQDIAVPANLSDPLLVKWVKYPGNPVLVPPPGIGAKDFRDPTTLWHVNGKWRSVVGSKTNTTGIALVYETTDFINYKLLDGTMHEVLNTGEWECADFYPISTTHAKGLENSVNGPNIKHVLKASLDDTKLDFYALGTYNPVKNTWTPDDPELDVGIGIQYDYGKYYASKAFYDQSTERRVLWGWSGETDLQINDAKKGWAGVQGIPREVTFDMKTKTNIIMWPVEEVESLRGSSTEFSKIVVEPGSIVPLNFGSATQLDIIAELEIDAKALEKTMEADLLYTCNTSNGAAGRGALGPFGLLVLADESHVEQTAVYFYIAKGTDGRVKTFFCTDQLRSSEAQDVGKQVYGSTVPVLDGEKLTMRILLDHSIVEAFAQGGRTCITSRIYPTRAIYEAAKVFIFNNATETTVTINSVKIWQMNSADIRPYPL